MRPFEWGVALTLLGCAIQTLISFLDYMALLGSHVHAIGGLSMGFKITMAFNLVTLFSLPIAAEVEAYLWLRGGRRSWTARLAFIAYSIGLATAIAWEINEILLISFHIGYHFIWAFGHSELELNELCKGRGWY